MSNEIIISGKLEAMPFGNPDKLGHTTDDGVILLNSDYTYYEQTKAVFCKVCNMNMAQLIKLRLSQPGKKDLHRKNLKSAAEAEWHRRNAVRHLAEVDNTL